MMTPDQAFWTSARMVIERYAHLRAVPNTPFTRELKGYLGVSSRIPPETLLEIIQKKIDGCNDAHDGVS